MLSEEELNELYKEINLPYTQKEFALHSKLRTIKSWLEITHAHNYDLITLLVAWENYLGGIGPKPPRKLWVMLRPGNNNDNAACARLHDIVDYFSQFEHGNLPRLPIVVYASRSSATLINMLDDFFYSRHITEIYHHIKEFFCLIAYEGKAKMTKAEFGAAMRREIDAFISECAQYAVELGEYIRKKESELSEKPLKVQIVRETKPTVKSKSHGKHTEFMKEQISCFKEFLNTHPVCASYTIINRARQCWREHKSEWDLAAKNRTGYSSYKTLARAV